MAMRLPVIGTNLGGIPEIVVDGVNGLLVKPGDAESLAFAMTRLLSKADWAQRLAHSGYQSVQERFSLERMTNEYSSLYRSLQKHIICGSEKL